MSTHSMARIIAHYPRAMFLPDGVAEPDDPAAGIRLPDGRKLRPASEVVDLLELAQLESGSVVLLVGPTAWECAVVAAVVKHVHAVERAPERAAQLRMQLEQHAIRNVSVHARDAALGIPDLPLFGRIVVCASSFGITPVFEAMVAPGGSLCLVTHNPQSNDAFLIRLRRFGDQVVEEVVRPLGDTNDIAQELVRSGLISLAQASEARGDAQRRHVPLEDALQQRAMITEVPLYRAIAAFAHLRFASSAELITKLDPSFGARLPRPFLKFHRFVPINIDEGQAIVATTNAALSTYALQSALQCNRVQPVLVTPTDFLRLWTSLELGRQPTDDIPESFAWEPIRLDSASDDVEQAALRLMDVLVLHAVGARASDLHIERERTRVRVRFRVDGDLIDYPHVVIPGETVQALVNVIKVAAALDISERRLPQGGRIQRRVAGRVYDMRVHIQPCIHGEHVIIRLLPQQPAVADIRSLGLSDESAPMFERMIQSPGGLLLVVGPTGSGKTTTVYAGLLRLSQDATRKVISAEDPIEYVIPGIQQTQVNPRIGFAFQDAMRSFVRQDPDVIFIGEIRDTETAREALRAAETGHLVLSTMHSNDTIDAIQRLLDLDMHPNTIASELLGIMAQRLAKRNCPHCRLEVDPDPELVAEVFPNGLPSGFRTFRGHGCHHCAGIGTWGRLACVEFLRTESHLRKLISRRTVVDVMREQAISHGLLTMRRAALLHVHHGRIPFTELRRVLPLERMSEDAAHDPDWTTIASEASESPAPG